MTVGPGSTESRDFIDATQPRANRSVNGINIVIDGGWLLTSLGGERR
jgi:hypothetical protein